MKKHLWLLIILFASFYGSHIDTNAEIFYIPNDLWQRDHSQMNSVGGLEASKPMILSTPANGSVFHGERNITPGYGSVLREEWTPTKPENYHYIKIGITATGYGEVAFTLKGRTKDYQIGHWTSEPLKKAVKEVYTYRIKETTTIRNPDREGFADEISPIVVSMSATGKAQTQSRQVVTYGSRQTAVNAQASATGPAVSFVIGSSTYWKWEAGITRDVDADDYNGSYSVTINDTNIDPGSGSDPESGSDSEGSGICPECGKPH